MISALDSDPGFREDESWFTPRRSIRCFRKTIIGSHRVRLHYHKALEICVFDRCEGFVQVDQGRYRTGRVLVVPVGSPHSFDLRAEHGSVHVVQVSFASLAPCLDAERILGGPLGAGAIPVTHPAYQNLVDLCLNFPTTATTETPTSVAFAAQLLRVLAEARTPGSRPDRTFEDTRLGDVVDHTERHFQNPGSLAVLAELTGMSPGAFCRWFKRVTGTKYTEYLEAVRLDRAKYLLAQGWPVTRVGLEVGFSTASHFIYRFHDREGCSPGKWGRAVPDGSLTPAKPI